MATLYQGEYFVVQHLRASACVRVIRNEAPFASILDAIAGLGSCRKALAGIDAALYGVLFDWRQAPISTDPSLHKALVEHIDALADLFARRAFLVRTVVGTMQVNRVSRTMSDQAMPIFSDEKAALDHLAKH